MIAYELPTTASVGGEERQIRSDFRAILDIISALNDPELRQNEKIYVILQIFYENPDEIDITDYEEAVNRCMEFLNCGKTEDSKRKQPKLMDWEQDFQYIISPINKLAGCDVRSMPYLHWWTFIGYYNEIGECMFSNIVSIRQKKAKGIKLDKSDREFYRNNRDVIDIKTKYTEAENNLFKELGV